MAKILLKIGGMSCSACSNGLEKYLNKQNGIFNASVNLVMSNALIEYDENILNQKKIEKFIKEAGFESLGIYKDDDEEKHSGRQKILFAVFGVLAALLMFVSMRYAMNLPESVMSDSTSKIPSLLSVILTVMTVPFLFYGADLIKSGMKNAVHRTPNMDTLVAIGVISSFAYSLYGTIMVLTGHAHYIHNLYYESAAIVIYFVKLGRYVDSVTKDKTKDAIKSLVQITPKDAVIMRDGKEITVTLDEIVKGDTVISRPGERIAVDGTVTSGKAHVDEAFITGESKPVTKEPGEKVIAGSTNYDGYLEYTAEKIGKESTVSEIVRIVVEATSTKAPLARIADKISGWFVPAVIIISVIGFIVSLIIGNGFAHALNLFVTVLVVACPCSLGLATPLAIVVSSGKCAKNGILIKKSEILENASKISTVVFDKTGTLTYGNLKISSILNYSDISENQLLKIISSVESKSSHPIAKAFVSAAEEKGISLYPAEGFKSIDGKGVSAEIDGKTYYAGNLKLLDDIGLKPETDDARTLASEGNSLVYLSDKERIIALFAVNDIVRDNAPEVIKSLKNIGITPVMLTGDNAATAAIIAEKVGIEKIISDVLPQGKGEAVKVLQKDGGKVMMVGDGINDSPALAVSDIGVSVNSGSDIAMDSSDVILVNNDLGKIVRLVEISKKTVRNIKQNLFWAFFYNSLMIPVALGLLSPIGIHINPMIASVAMTLSSLTVIINALRLKK